MTVPVTIRIQEADFDVAREIAALTNGRTDIGAVSLGEQRPGSIRALRRNEIGELYKAVGL